jgi:hypothetical protein
MNPLKNDSYGLLTFIQKYQNPLGIALQIAIENAILEVNGVNGTDYQV